MRYRKFKNIIYAGSYLYIMYITINFNYGDYYINNCICYLLSIIYYSFL